MVVVVVESLFYCCCYCGGCCCCCCCWWCGGGCFVVGGRFFIIPPFLFFFMSTLRRLLSPQKLGQETKLLEQSRDALEAEANAKLSERNKELEALRARTSELSSKLEVTMN